MGIDFFKTTILAPQEVFHLRQGKIREPRLSSSALSSRNLLAAMEVLFAINELDNLTSQADVVERAFAYGWRPVEETESQGIQTRYRFFVFQSIRGTAISAAKFLLKVLPEG